MTSGQEQADTCLGGGNNAVYLLVRFISLGLVYASAPLAWKDDFSRLAFHFLDEFGKRQLRWLDTEDGQDAIYQWAKLLKTHTAKRERLPLAPRSVWNVYSSIKVMLDDGGHEATEGESAGQFSHGQAPAAEDRQEAGRLAGQRGIRP